MNYFQELLEALRIEKKYDKFLFLELTAKLPLHEKVKTGAAWYPLQIKESGYSIGEYPYLLLEIDKSKLVPHQFKAGANIKFFTNASAEYYQNFAPATIHYVSGNQIKIILNSNDLPEWTDMGKLGIEIDFDEKSYKEMEDVLMRIIKTEPDKKHRIIKRIEGSLPHKRNILHNILKPAHLNTSQQIALSEILQSDDICIVHGPPGTGKTTTLVEAIYETALMESTVLVTAPSNAAVDLLVEKLSNRGLEVVRVGNLSRIDPAVMHHSLEYKITHNKMYLDIKKLKKQADEYRRMANRYTRKFGPDEKEQRRLLLKEAKDLIHQARWIEDDLIDEVLNKAQVICTTLVGTENVYLKKRTYQTCFIDEAAQALEPACWIPILKSQKVVLAGDPFQLPPTVKSTEPGVRLLNQTLMERLFQKIEEVYLLDTQYRMNDLIMGYSNAFFYQNKLKSHVDIKDHSFLPDAPVLTFIDTAGCGFQEMRNENTESLYNPEEYILLFKHLEKTLIDLESKYGHISVGIIAPYKEQVKYMTEHDPEDLGLTITHSDIQIQTIDSFQGQEKDIVYISLVRSNDRSEIGFLKDYRRMNVAITRAKKMLVVIGDSATIGEDIFYNGFIEYCQSHQAYCSAWEFMA